MSKSKTPPTASVDPVVMPWDRFGVHGCSNGATCSWKGFHFGPHGIALGSKPCPTDAWQRAHDQQCSGEIIQIVQPRGAA